MKQPWICACLAVVFQALTTLPARSNSMTGGEDTASTSSGAIRLPRLTVKTWSRESVQVPATSPVTQGLGLPVDVLSTRGAPKSPALGSGSLGQAVSARNCGTWGEPRV